MNTKQLLEQLTKIANQLDENNHTTAATQVDELIKKISLTLVTDDFVPPEDPEEPEDPNLENKEEFLAPNNLFQLFPEAEQDERLRNYILEAVALVEEIANLEISPAEAQDEAATILSQIEDLYNEIEGVDEYDDYDDPEDLSQDQESNADDFLEGKSAMDQLIHVLELVMLSDDELKIISKAREALKNWNNWIAQ